MRNALIYENPSVYAAPFRNGVFIVKIFGRMTHIGEFYTFLPTTFAIHINSVHQRGKIYIPGDTNKILAISDLLTLIFPDSLQPMKPSIVIDKNMTSYRFMEFVDSPLDRIAVYRERTG